MTRSNATNNDETRRAVTEPARTALRDAARTYDVDRYLSALLAPKSVRDDLVALAAFSGELSRIPATVSEPTIGEIRLQWWWDALENGAQGKATGHPVADAVAGLVRRGVAEKAPLQDIVDAYREQLFAEPAANDKALAWRIDATDGALFRAAARVVAVARGGEVSQDSRAALYAAAHGYGLAKLVRDLPVSLARGQPPIVGLPAGAQRLPVRARAALATARDVTAGLSAEDRAVVWPAMLPAALIEPYLRAFEGASTRGSGWADAAIDITPLRRAWALLRARATGRL